MGTSDDPVGYSQVPVRPNQLIVRTYLLRGAGFWLAVRCVSGLVLAFAGLDPLRFTIGASVVVVVLSLAVGFVEIGLRREWALLGNLGVSPLVLGCIFAGPAAVGETLLKVLAATL